MIRTCIVCEQRFVHAKALTCSRECDRECSPGTPLTDTAVARAANERAATLETLRKEREREKRFAAAAKRSEYDRARYLLKRTGT